MRQSRFTETEQASPPCSRRRRLASHAQAASSPDCSGERRGDYRSAHARRGRIWPALGHGEVPRSSTEVEKRDGLTNTHPFSTLGQCDPVAVRRKRTTYLSKGQALSRERTVISGQPRFRLLSGVETGWACGPIPFLPSAERICRSSRMRTAKPSVGRLRPRSYGVPDGTPLERSSVQTLAPQP